MYYSYLGPQILSGFDSYKYSSKDTSPLSNYVMHPFWNQVRKKESVKSQFKFELHLLYTGGEGVSPLGGAQPPHPGGLPLLHRTLRPARALRLQLQVRDPGPAGDRAGVGLGHGGAPPLLVTHLGRHRWQTGQVGSNFVDNSFI